MERMRTTPIVESDFRAEPESLAWIKDKAWYVATCHELIDGRWEGFVSMRPAPIKTVGQAVIAATAVSRRVHGLEG